MAPSRQPSTSVRADKASTPTKSTSITDRSAAAKPSRRAASEPVRPMPTNRSGNARLGKGGLEALVSDHLKAHPKGDFSPSELANVLGRSAGAILNALERLVGKGEASRVSDAPRRYRHRATRGGKANTRKRS